jgi:hypothetical protein
MALRSVTSRYQKFVLVIAPAGVRSRAALRNSQADTSHSAAKKLIRTTMTLGQFSPVEPSSATRAMMPTKT